MRRKILKNLMIHTEEKLIENGYLIIEDDVISAVGEGSYPENNEKAEVFDFIDNDFLAIPGLINAHTHSGMAPLKCVGDDLPFDKWLFDTIIPLEDKLDEEMIYLATLISQMEMTRNGVTSFVDMYMMLEQIISAVSSFGMRAYICRGLVDSGSEEGRLKKNIAAYEKYHGSANERISIGFGPHSPYLCSTDYLKAVSEVAKTNDALIHIHLKETAAESDSYTFRALAKLGLFDTRTVAAHCVYVTDDDIQVLSDFDICVAHNPSSNLKLANGIAPVEKMIRKGVNVALGTDSVSSNNNLDVWREMLLVSLIHKGVTKDPECVTAHAALRMATLNAARGLGWEDVGLIKKGYKADIAIINMDNINLFPNNNTVSSIVYSGRGSDVYATMIDGEFVYQNGCYTTIDEEDIRKKFMKKFVELYR